MSTITASPIETGQRLPPQPWRTPARQALPGYEMCRCPQCGYQVMAVIYARHTCPLCSSATEQILMEVI